MTDEPNTEEYQIIDRRKNGYREVEAKLDSHAEEIERRFDRWFKWGLVAFSIIAITSGIAIVGYGFVLRSQADFTRDIQQQRREATVAACQETNDRNKHTVDALKAGSSVDKANAPDDAARAEIERRVQVTIALINALAPVQDCTELADQRVKGDGP